MYIKNFCYEYGSFYAPFNAIRYRFKVKTTLTKTAPMDGTLYLREFRFSS